MGGKAHSGQAGGQEGRQAGGPSISVQGGDGLTSSSGLCISFLIRETSLPAASTPFLESADSSGRGRGRPSSAAALGALRTACSSSFPMALYSFETTSWSHRSSCSRGLYMGPLAGADTTEVAEEATSATAVVAAEVVAEELAAAVTVAALARA